MEPRTLAGITALALAARLVAAAVIAPSAESLLASAHHEHASIAKNLAEGRGFRFNFFGDIHRPDLTSQQAPFVPGLLALSYLLFGVESPAALWFVVALQMIVGAVAGVVLGDAVRSWSGDRRRGVFAGVIAAMYPPFVAASLHVQALPWNLLWLALMLSGSGRLRSGRRRGAILFVGGSVGGLYTDPILVVVVATLAGIVAMQRPERLRCVRITLVVGAAVAPWIARNYEVHGRFAFIKDSFPYVFWQGNTLLSAGTDKLLVDESERQQLQAGGLDAIETARRRSRSINDVALSEADLRDLAALPGEASRMDWFGRRIRAELSAHPWHYPRMCLVRLRQWLWFDDTNPKSMALPYRISYLVLVGGALIGSAAGPSQPWAFGAAGVALSLVHILVITSARFRVCFELLLVPFFAAGVMAGISLVCRAAAFRRIPPMAPTPAH